MTTKITSLLPTSADLKANMKSALILTPAIFMLAFWIMVFSSNSILAVAGLPKMLFWALVLAFGCSYSITMFVSEILKQNEK